MSTQGMTYLLQCSAWQPILLFLSQCDWMHLMLLSHAFKKQLVVFWTKTANWINPVASSPLIQFIIDFDGDSTDLGARYPELKHLALLVPKHSDEKNATSFTSFPSTLTSLNLGYSLNTTLPPFPAQLRTLILSSCFEQPLPPLPDTLQILIFGIVWNHSPLQLPSSLLYLKLSESYKHPFLLPEQLIRFEMGHAFNQPFTSLPPTLNTLILGKKYNQILPTLPSTLETLMLGKNYNQVLPSLPPTLKMISFEDEFQCALPTFPSSLEHLVINAREGWNIPSHVRILKSTFGNRKLPHLPDTLTKLHLPMSYDEPLVHLPSSLTTLDLGYCFNQPLPDIPTLKRLKTGKCFDQVLPTLSALTFLELSGNFEHFPVTRVPDALKYLVVHSNRINWKVPLLPSTLISIDKPPADFSSKEFLRFRERVEFLWESCNN